MDTFLPLRDEIERESRMLLEVAGSLTDGLPLRDWPADQVACLAASLDRAGLDRFEARKVDDLVQHLFGGLPVPADLTIDVEPDPFVSDRLRSDLTGCVPYMAGAHLVDMAALVKSWSGPAPSVP